MGYTFLFIGILFSIYTVITHHSDQLATRTFYTLQKQDAMAVATQMLSLSQALGHWRWENPQADSLPDIASLNLPFVVPDSRIHWALSGGRLWVWANEEVSPGLAARLVKDAFGSGLIFRVHGGAMYDLQGKAISMASLSVPPSLQSASGTQLLHLN